MFDAGGGLFIFAILLISLFLQLTWLFKGKGKIRWKLKFTGIYLALAMLPILMLYQFLDEKENQLVLSNLIFVFGLFVLFYGFIIPPLSKLFENRQKYAVHGFGEFEYSGGCWHVEVNTESQGKIFISVDGSKKSPSKNCIDSALHILMNVDSFIDKAKLRMQSADVINFSSGNGDFVFDGFHCREDIEFVDFDFGLSKWDDASITVHFKNGEAHDVSLGD